MDTKELNYSDSYQDKFKVLISDSWGFLWEEDGKKRLEFSSESEARAYIKITPWETGGLRLVTRPIVNGKYSAHLPEIDEGVPYVKEN